ncbi:MAG: hypothetical protein KJ025_18110 [Burkholderiales bacterium]|nr:hypothetical protein [Burkholderiales bacterium]
MTRAAALVALAVAGCVALGACTISRPALQRQLFVLHAERAGPPAIARKPVALKVGVISVVPTYSGRSLTYRTGELRRAADPYAGFFAAPRDLIAEEVAQWLDRSGLFAAVRDPASPVGAPYVLDGVVTELYGDVRDPGSAAAVVAVRFHLHTENDRNNPLFERAYAQRIEVGNGAPATLVKGYGDALGRILADLEADLAKLDLK